MVEESRPLKSVEAALRAVDERAKQLESFTLPISDSLQDAMGLNMVIILDRILSHGRWMPDGFEQRSGFRVYRYKRSERASDA